MTLDLKAINYLVDKMKNKKGKTLGVFTTNVGKIPRSPEELVQLGTMAPASNGHYVSNNYKLRLDVRLDACCCPTVPQFTVPLSVIPICPAESYGFVEPQGYAPVDLGYYKLTLTTLPPPAKTNMFGF